MNTLTIILSVMLGGILGNSVDANYEGRISQFINSPESPAIQIYTPEKATSGGWKGEHAGKWLYAASHAYSRTQDPKLLSNIISVADFLISQQQDNGYIGCYKNEKRFYHIPENGAYCLEWDLWNFSYLMQGFSELYKVTGKQKYIDAANKMMNLMYDTFIVKGRSIANCGEHAGLVGVGSIYPLCDLYEVSPSSKCKELIERCIYEIDETPGMGLIAKAAAGLDLKFVSDGKIYEMLRTLVGIAKAYELFGEKRLLEGCLGAWKEISAYHLTPLGGPWGGINISPEVFNSKCAFQPYQISETCEVMDWMHFNQELLKITGEARFANAIEKTAYNSLIAAQAEDGNRWIYYLKTDGSYWTGDQWSCCWSSGMIALESLCDMIYSVKGKTIYANVITPSSAVLKVSGKEVRISQSGEYIYDGKASYKIDDDASFTFAVAIPDWAKSYKVTVNDSDVKVSEINGGYVSVSRKWKAGDVLNVEFPCETRQVENIWQFRDDPKYQLQIRPRKEHYVCFAKGPLVYACEHEDKIDKQNQLQATRSELDAVNIQDTEFTIAGQTFRPILEMRPYSTKTGNRTIWIHVSDE